MAVTIAGLTGKEIVALCNKADDRYPLEYANLCEQDLSDEEFLEAVKALAAD